MTPELAEMLIDRLLDGWEQALHNVDSLFQVVQLVPDWQAKWNDALNDSFRRQVTTDRFASMREAVKEIRQGKGVESVPLIAARLAKPPN